MRAFHAFGRSALPALAGLLLGGFVSIGAALAETRLALVIGNSDYSNVTAIPNPVRDADSMTDLLKSAKFDVVVAKNLSRLGMQRAVSNFAARVAESGPDTVALVFYAGHGIQVDGQNYLVPVDARIARETDLPLEAMRLRDLMNVLRQVPAKARIVILDSCRNNPFTALDGQVGRGLAIVDAPEGSIVAYSTAPGAVASDGSGDHSPFTSALLQIARQPGLSIEQAFKQVRLAVNRSTDGAQTPWESTSLTTNFSFFPGDGQPSAPEAKIVTVVKWKEVIHDLTPDEAYDRVIGAGTLEAYEAFLALFERAAVAPGVQAIYDRRVQMVMWLYATTVDTAAAYEAFLSRYPDSDLAPTARRLQERARERSRSLASLDEASQAFAFAGDAASSVRVVTRTVEKEIPVEKIVVRRIEVPKIVEKRIEVPVERIVVRHVEVPKIVTKVVTRTVRVPVNVCHGGNIRGPSHPTRPPDHRRPRPRHPGLR